MNEKQLKKKILEYRILQAKLEALIKQKEIIVQKIEEANSVLKAISELRSEKEAIFPIGFNSYVKTKILSEKILVEIGSNIILEKPKEKALELLSLRKSELQKSLKNIESEYILISKKLQQLASEISKSDKDV